MISRRLNAILGRPKTVIDHSITAKLLNKFASVTGGWMSKMFDDAVFLPRGHTVLATYRKDGALDRE
jgi:hypothetical protein